MGRFRNNNYLVLKQEAECYLSYTLSIFCSDFFEYRNVEEIVFIDNVELSLTQLNGFNCLLRDQIGFWTELVKQKMPASRFLIQTDEFEFEELVRNSSLLCFSTSIATPLNQPMKDRKAIPLTDAEVHVTYCTISTLVRSARPKNKKTAVFPLQFFFYIYYFTNSFTFAFLPTRSLK